jgi:hypothetical protein
MTVSAWARDASRHGTRSVTWSDSTSADSLQTRTSYAARPSFLSARPNTSHAVDKSPSTTPSNAMTATTCALLGFFRGGVNPAMIVFLATGGFWHVL